MVYYSIIPLVSAPVTFINKSEEQNTNLPPKVPLWVSFSPLAFVEISVGWELGKDVFSLYEQ